MKLAMIGLGKMGYNMTLRLMKGGHQVVVWNNVPEPIQKLAAQGAVAASGMPDLVKKLEAPRVVWCMVPSGPPTEGVITELEGLLARGDIIVDGGNSNFHDSQRRAAGLAEKGIRFLDAGTSGGVWGLTVGYCLMVGGDEAAFRVAEPALATLAPEGGYRRVGGSGAGHYSKMVHNAMEYGIMQAYAEGFELLSASGFDFDLAGLAALWGQGSVIRSWLLELAQAAFEKDPGLTRLTDYVEDSGEGRWTLVDSVDRAVPMPVLAMALQARFRSRQESSFAGRVLAALRNEFGGHAVKKAD